MFAQQPKHVHALRIRRPLHARTIERLGTAPPEVELEAREIVEVRAVEWSQVFFHPQVLAY